MATKAKKETKKKINAKRFYFWAQVSTGGTVDDFGVETQRKYCEGDVIVEIEIKLLPKQKALKNAGKISIDLSKGE